MGERIEEPELRGHLGREQDSEQAEVPHDRGAHGGLLSVGEDVR
jgi:hypothetical protein